MFDVFIFTEIEMPFTEREKRNARSHLYKTVQHAFVKEFQKQSPTAKQICTWHKKIQRGWLFVQEKGNRIKKNIRRDSRVFVKKSCNAQRNRCKEQVWKPRFHQQLVAF